MFRVKITGAIKCSQERYQERLLDPCKDIRSDERFRVKTPGATLGSVWSYQEQLTVPIKISEATNGSENACQERLISSCRDTRRD